MSVLWDIGRTALFSLTSIVTLFFLTKMIGNRQVSQLSLFDYINGITIGSIAAELATSLETDVAKPLTAMVIYALATFAVSIFSSKSLRFRRFAMGRPLVLMEDGRIYARSLARARVDLSEMQMQLRGMGYFNMDDVQTVVMEPNGRMSVLARSARRPVCPEDLGLRLPEEKPVTNVILDGAVLKDNLRRTGNNEKWLENRLKELGLADPARVFLATCDGSNVLSVYLRITKEREKDIFT